MRLSGRIKQPPHACLITHDRFREDRPLIAGRLKHTRPRKPNLLQTAGISAIRGLTCTVSPFRGRASNTVAVPNPRAERPIDLE